MGIFLQRPIPAKAIDIIIKSENNSNGISNYPNPANGLIAL